MSVSVLEVLTAFIIRVMSYTSVFTLMMEAVSTSEMSVCFYETTWHINPEYCLYTYHLENLKSVINATA
jgi:hypothetical protein